MDRGLLLAHRAQRRGKCTQLAGFLPNPLAWHLCMQMSTFCIAFLRLCVYKRLPEFIFLPVTVANPPEYQECSPHLKTMT